MDFQHAPKAGQRQQRLSAFMDEHAYPEAELGRYQPKA